MNNESVEIDVTMSPQGDLVIPKSVLERLNLKDGSRVRVRVTTDSLTGELKRRNVTEEEIERIVSLQLEPRENVVKFLSTESALRGDRKFLQRARGLRSLR